MKRRGRLMGCFLTVMMGMGAATVPADDYHAPRRAPKCQIMDRYLEPLMDADVTYLYRSGASQPGRMGLLELGMRANWAYFRSPIGDVDVSSGFLGTWFVDSGDIDLPNQLFMLRLPVTWIGRFDHGVSARVTLKPGYYGDGERIDMDALYMPVSFSLVRAFADDFSGLAGLEFRSGFERRWFPLFGAVWQPHDALRVEALLPRGGVSLAPGRDWRFRLGYAWDSTDYRLDDDHKQVNMEDFRWTFGITRVLHSEIELTTEAGYVTDRRIIYRRDSDDRINLDNTFFIRFGVAAPF